MHIKSLTFFIILSLWCSLYEAARVKYNHLRGHTSHHIVSLPKREEIVAAPVMEPVAEPVVGAVPPEPIEATNPDVAYLCGKKVQSEKPLDPAGDFLNCYLQGAL
jgi:hypothetical protein